MTEDETTSIVLSGISDAGKSTWLAALWQVLETDEFESELKLRRYLGNQRYIAELNGAWTRCEKFGRTSMNSPGSIAVELQAPDASLVKLELPDLSGELFRDHWAYRHWERGFDEDVKDANGMILMVSTLTEGILMLRDALELVNDEESPSSPGSSEVPAEAQQDGDWDPLASPAQVKLVEHLQFVAHQRGREPIPVAVMLSAWDQVREAKIEIRPDEWLAQELPLLHQFLVANRDTFPHEVFGVSAQGGDLDRDRVRLLDTPPIERLEVVGPNGTSHDLTIPLAWVVGTKNG